MSQKEFQRVKVIENAAAGRLSVREASPLLQLSERQVPGAPSLRFRSGQALPVLFAKGGQQPDRTMGTCAHAQLRNSHRQHRYPPPRKK